MKEYNLRDMIGGWFIGDFTPTALSTKNFEVGVKRYLAGEKAPEHFHKIATEITLLLSGSVRMLGRTWTQGDIVVIEPGESTSFEAIEDTVTVVVKIPAVKNDKWMCGS
jgi:quercetin dioxygenase-like cupin family protein